MSFSRTLQVRLRLDGSVDGLPLATNTTVQVVVQRPKLHILEVARFAFFEDREVLLPDIEVLPPDVPGPDRVPGVEVAAAALRFLDQHRQKRLLVVGHTDTVGSDKDNTALSERRAQNVFLYLSGDVEGWARHAHDNHEIVDLQSILVWISATFPDFDCHPGEVDGEYGPFTRAALQDFRDDFAEHAKIAAWTGKTARVEDWRAFMHLYDDAVAARLGGRKKLRELREAAPFTSPAFVGLGERYPSERPDQDGLDNERNRRVDLVFLDPDEEVYIEDKDSVETLLYAPESVARREWIPLGFPAQADELVVKVQTEDGQPISGAHCTLTLPGGEVREAQLDAAGIVSFLGIPPLAGVFRLPDFEAFDWDAIADAVRPLPPPPVHEDDLDDEPDDDNLPPLTAAERAVFDLDDDDEDMEA